MKPERWMGLTLLAAGALAVAGMPWWLIAGGGLVGGVAADRVISQRRGASQGGGAESWTRFQESHPDSIGKKGQPQGRGHEQQQGGEPLGPAFIPSPWYKVMFQELIGTRWVSKAEWERRMSKRVGRPVTWEESMRDAPGGPKQVR